MTEAPLPGPASQSGFTILEIMISILILSIILIIAMPAYQNYRVRARVADMLVAVIGVKNNIGEYYMVQRQWPPDNTAAGLPAPAEYANEAVQSVTVENGAITIVSDIIGLEGQTLVVTPRINGSVVNWDCKGGTLESQYRPAQCRP